ncbi:restriction endonuclease subunit S [Polaromonas hydrogenivorans]|uniref:Restriction endonuclease subunit S n=1 Tax=Polaromonas hydrogenivorans TaxID=335476 RepID=A0AAU7LR66_9BURK
MSGWLETSTGKLIDAGVLKIGDGYRAKNDELVASGFPFARAGNINNGFQFSGADCLPSHYAEIVGEKASRSGDTVFTSKGTVGRFGFVTEKTEKFIYSPQLCFWRSLKQDEIFPLFVYYWMHGNEFLGQVEGLKGQTDMADYVNLADQRRMSITLPSFFEQKAIAILLGSLDDKLDLLHRQNKTLEAMAETLFRQWFVEDVQEGWNERPLSGIANFLNGLACQKYPPTNDLEKLPVLKIRELSSGISETADWATNQVKPRYIVEAGDVIFAWSASLMVKVWDGEKCVLNQHLFKVTSDEFPKWFYLRWCKHHLAEFIAVAASHATTMGHIKRGDLDAAMVLVPPPSVLETMSKQMQPLLDKQIAIARQRKTLEKLRDTLLPKLMNGEVRVAY